MKKDFNCSVSCRNCSNSCIEKEFHTIDVLQDLIHRKFEVISDKTLLSKITINKRTEKTYDVNITLELDGTSCDNVIKNISLEVLIYNTNYYAYRLIENLIKMKIGGE